MAQAAAGGSIVYVGCTGSKAIEVLRLDPQGGLTPLARVPLPNDGEAGPSTPMALSPDKRFLYAGIRSQPFRVAAFAIEAAAGALRLLGEAPLADSMAYIATDRSGRHLLSASYGGSRIAVNPIDADGRVGAPSQVIDTEPKAHAILADPSNAYVLSTSLGGDLLHRFAFDAATGRLTGGESAARVETGSGPRHFVFHPNGRFLFLLSELNAGVDVFAVDEGLALRHLHHVRALPEGFAGKPWAADIHVTPDGRLLYAAERTSSTLHGYVVDLDTGALTPCGVTPTETQPRGFAIDPSGRFLIAAGETSHGVTSYAIDPANGTLAPRTRLETGLNPNWIEIVPLASR